MNTDKYYSVIETCKNNFNNPGAFIDCDNGVEWWYTCATLFFRKMTVDGKWKLCVPEEELPLAIRIDEEQDIISNVDDETNDSPCAGCERDTCLTCPIGNPDYYLGRKDAFGEEIN